MEKERKMVVFFVLPLGCIGSACYSVWRFGWQFYQVSPASRTCFQAHRYWQTLWNLDQTWNHEKMNKGSHPVRRMIENRVIPLLAKRENKSHPKINKADVVIATHTTNTSWKDDFSWWWCHSNWVSQPRYRQKPFGGLSWGGWYEGVPPVNNQASSNSVVSQDTDVAVLLLVHFDKMKCQKIWIKR